MAALLSGFLHLHISATSIHLWGLMGYEISTDRSTCTVVDDKVGAARIVVETPLWGRHSLGKGVWTGL